MYLFASLVDDTCFTCNLKNKKTKKKSNMNESILRNEMQTKWKISYLAKARYLKTLKILVLSKKKQIFSNIYENKIRRLLNVNY